MSLPAVSGASPVLQNLVRRCLAASPWLSYHGEVLAIDWPLAMQAAMPALGPPWSEPHAQQVLRCLGELLPRVLLPDFATTATAIDPFALEERVTALAYASSELPPSLTKVLATWGGAVENFRRLVARKDAASLTFMQHREAHFALLGQLRSAIDLAHATTLHHTLNLKLDFGRRLVVAAANMADVVRGTSEGRFYELSSRAHRQEVWHLAHQLCQLRLDLLTELADDPEAPLPQATLTSLARREHELYVRLNTRQSEQRSAKDLLEAHPGFGIGLALGEVLPIEFRRPPSAFYDDMFLSGTDLPPREAPTPALILLKAVSDALPNPYALWSIYSDDTLTDGAQRLAQATSLALNRLRGDDNARGKGRHAGAPAVVPSESVTIARDCESLLAWTLAHTPLLTLLLSSTLATYPHAEGWGLCLSPWCVATSLSQSVLGTLPLTYLRPAPDDEPGADTAPASDAGLDQGAAADAPITGAKVWQVFAK